MTEIDKETAKMNQVTNVPKIAPLSPMQSKADEIARLQTLYELSVTLSGDPVEIFSHVARMIGELLDVKVVCLSEVRGEELYFLSVYVQGEIYKDAGHCPLSITPCATVEASKDFRVYDKVMERFPKASFLKDHNAYSYCGFPALNNDNQVVAVTCLLDDRPHEFTDADRDMLRIFGQRIGMEIERQKHIEEKEQAQQELQSYQKHLEYLVAERTRELEAFSYSISHDLRAPLRAIMGYSDILLNTNQKNLGEEDLHFLRRINKAGKHMNDLIDSLLGLSQINRCTLDRKTVDLSSMAKDIIDKYRESEPDRSVVIDIQNQIQAKVDRVLVHSLLDNLLGNAWKYTAKTSNARIQFKTQQQSGKLVCTVADNGVGFDPRFVNQLFKPFSRLHDENEFQGTGIGLAIVKRIVERHGGSIWANCQQGETIFSFTLD